MSILRVMFSVPLASVIAIAMATEPPPAKVRAADIETSYVRLMDSAVSRAQAELVASTDLWVDHSSWSNAWVVDSNHYSVRTTSSHYLAQKIALDLEYILGEVRALLGTDFEPAQPLEVLIYPRLADYNDAGERAVGDIAAVHSSIYASFYAVENAERSVATYFTPNVTQLGMWVTHSAVHQYLHSAFRATPPIWVSEGLAAYFALYWDWGWGASELRRLSDRDRSVPLRQLLGASLSDFGGQGEDRLIQLGMLFNYLLNHREDTRRPTDGSDEPSNSFATFLREVVRGRAVRDTGFAQLTSNELDALDAELRAFDFED